MPYKELHHPRVYIDQSRRGFSVTLNNPFLQFPPNASLQTTNTNILPASFHMHAIVEFLVVRNPPIRPKPCDEQVRTIPVSYITTQWHYHDQLNDTLVNDAFCSSIHSVYGRLWFSLMPNIWEIVIISDTTVSRMIGNYNAVHSASTTDSVPLSGFVSTASPLFHLGQESNRYIQQILWCKPAALRGTSTALAKAHNCLPSYEI